jgi:hypothetical protein
MSALGHKRTSGRDDVGQREAFAGQPRPCGERLLHFAEIAGKSPTLRKLLSQLSYSAVDI